MYFTLRDSNILSLFHSSCALPSVPQEQTTSDEILYIKKENHIVFYGTCEIVVAF